MMIIIMIINNNSSVKMSYNSLPVTKGSIAVVVPKQSE